MLRLCMGCLIGGLNMLLGVILKYRPEALGDNLPALPDRWRGLILNGTSAALILGGVCVFAWGLAAARSKPKRE